DGWDCILKNNWQAPLYWYRRENKWSIFTLNGLMPLDLAEPVSHISYYEAEAYARWRGLRLPTEEEWEHFVVANSITPEKANLLEKGHLHPQAASEPEKLEPQQFFGDLWEWTSSAYSAYPGYEAFGGELNEYNGKFMTNQMVLRGGSCVTPGSHIRASYRNFYQPEKRWQFSGIRLANNVKE
ncbi:MAG: ergothioneine biosynthesis protein EgtB, partial [Tatlockia sp.]|nr:ergothioneine biosynthesis protein EgtB [Tatlockia sp.]